MAGNKWTNRRGLIPKPSVCKKQPRLATLIAILNIDVFSPAPPIPPTDTVQLKNRLETRSKWTNEVPGINHEFACELTWNATTYSFDLHFVFRTYPSDGGAGGQWTFDAADLVQHPSQHGTIHYAFSRIDPDHEPGTVDIYFP